MNGNIPSGAKRPNGAIVRATIALQASIRPHGHGNVCAVPSARIASCFARPVGCCCAPSHPFVC